MLGGTANATATATGGTLLWSVSNANSSATTINGNAAQAKSTATVGCKRAGPGNRTDQFRKFHNRFKLSPQAPLAGPPDRPVQSHRPVVSFLFPTPIIAGQSFSVVSGSGFGPLTVANGSMGAGYGGTGASLTYQESASFTQNGGTFVLDLLSSDALGIGFDNALFEISLNSVVIDSHSFTDLASAEAFFSNNLISVPLSAGPNSIQLAI